MEKQPSRWETYQKQTAERPPSKSLAEAIALVPARDAALDLGAGALRDSKYLLSEGFKKVIAVDSEPAMHAKAEALHDERLEAAVAPFQEFNFPVHSLDVVNAQYSLPFTPPDSFDEVFHKMKGSLKEGGIFVGQLFGKNDEWKDNPNMTFHSLEQVQELFKDMERINLREEERDGITAAGTQKHWHVFDITARK